MWVLALLCGSAFLNFARAGGACPLPPRVEFATAEPEKRVYEPGEHVIYTCNPGYVLRSGQRKWICPISGVWNSPTMKCKRRLCAYPGPLENGLINHTEFTYQSWIQFSCNEGFILNGSDVSQCTETGQWSNQQPVCERVICPKPAIPEFGKIKFYKPKSHNMSTYQDVVIYECLPKYALFGNEAATCEANGNWSDVPECIDVKCTRPNDIENGFMTFAIERLYDYMETVRYGCDPPYTLDGPRISQCEKTGNWSTTPTCKPACQIPDKKGVVIYSGQKVKLQDMKKHVIRHTDSLTFYCKDEKNNCAYTVTTQCIDGALPLPPCFKESPWHSFFLTYTNPSDMKPCVGEI
ncbi:beta-2-glycoprotein 1 [Ambystoma mexicanum]|uniref:beta-2-glycoprotein 1 n=1 Tax=Ambystoma mexicanum TaxID=8296 RepID=UPI0037E71682